jgi:hypothetical protein
MATEVGVLASARASLYAAEALSAAALDRLYLDDVSASQVATILQAAGALIDAVAPVVSLNGDGGYVDHIVGVAQSLHGA